MLSIAICDDDFEVRESIEKSVADFGTENNLPITVRSFNTGEGLINFLMTDRSVRLIFLDILLELENGVKIAGIIRETLDNQSVQIVYISSIKNLYPEMFACRPMNFLTKPIAEDKVFEKLSKCIKLANGRSRTFTYKVAGEIYNRSLDEIVYFEGSDRQIKIVSVDDETFFYGKIQSVYDEVKADGFKSFGNNVKRS